jgi:hypothetical protein
VQCKDAVWTPWVCQVLPYPKLTTRDANAAVSTFRAVAFAMINGASTLAKWPRHMALADRVSLISPRIFMTPGNRRDILPG